MVDQVLAAFVLEARRAVGNYYPGTTIKNILAALCRGLKQKVKTKNVVTFVEKASQERHYPQLQNALDWHLRELHSHGIGTEVSTPDIEEQLWSMGVMGYRSPKALLNAVVYYNGKNFCLRGVKEHQSLRFGQLHRLTDQYIYTKFGSKNLSSGVNDASEGKRVSIVATGA